MRALVTGVAGFIGSHLAEQLVEKGFSVEGIDCFTPYYPEELKRRNLVRLLDRQNFHFVAGDIIDVDLGDLVGNCDIVFHLAAQPGVRASWSSFSEYARNNLLATQALLESCAKTGKKRFVFASSSSVYGDAERYPTPERAALKPSSPYGVTKEGAERLCRLYHSKSWARVVILRYFTVYGPRQRPDMAMNRFIEMMLSNRPVPVYGDGRQVRDFTYVSDIVDGTIKAAEVDVLGETFNIGGGNPVALIDVLKILKEKTNTNSVISHEPAQRGDVSKTAADISKARKLLGYRPVVPLREGLANQVEWQREQTAERTG